ncbi:hypothetical protein AVEN_195992-1 [Araneus ventricosus]|uniref:Peptidase A2 domain-containing protein n=1 Tax=Araneus ventricosus TaxID=182803 RepID=A0A4Y2DU46_ARAVE|nr:hypothetical protein AVEN_195992-1 [Araneus ventricosus]
MHYFVRAERIGDRNLHLYSVQRMLVHLHAAGNIHYTKSAHLYLQNMSNLKTRLSDQDFERFRSTQHVFALSRVPQRGKLNPMAQDNVITTTERKKEDESTVLTPKINVPVEVAANVIELETVQVKFGPRTMKGIVDSETQISVIREDFTSGIKYEGEGYIEISSVFGERETTPLQIFDVNIVDGVPVT